MLTRAVPRLGIVDLGSNTVRLVVYDWEPGRWYRLVDEIREPLRLGAGLAEHGALSAEAMHRASAVLELFRDYARAHELDRLQIIGTSAIRDASNKREFLAHIEPLGLQVAVLGGEDEAELGVLAVANSMSARDAWVMDLGGGSAQLSRMRNRVLTDGTAHPLGAVRLSEQVRLSDPARPSEITALEQVIASELGPLATRMRADEHPFIAMGGTIRNLARAAQRREAYPLRSVHGHVLTLDSLDSVISHLLSTRASKADLPGINPDRADIIVAGALVFRWLLRHSGRQSLTICGHGVRHGVLYRHFLPAPHLLADVRRFHVANLLQNHVATADNEGIGQLASALFRALAPLHGFGRAEHDMLHAATTLRDIGKTVDYYRHHKHAYYIACAAQLGGFTHREQALIALLLRYQKGGTPKLGELAPLAQPGDKQRLLVTTTCFRLARALNRSRSARVRDLDVRIDDARVLLRVVSDPEPLIEIWEANQHAALFERCFGRKLVIERADPGR